MAEKKPQVRIILVAGGSGVRFGSSKQFEILCGKPILEWSLETALSVTTDVVTVLPEKESDLDGSLNLSSLPATTYGGSTRSASVRAGMRYMEMHNPIDPAEIILVHDAVRPLASKELFQNTVQAILDGADAATPAISVSDTVHTNKQEILDRQELLLLQTPQAFRGETLLEIHKTEPEATDDISLCILNNKQVTYIEGDTTNIKITEPHDLEIAAALMTAKNIQGSEIMQESIMEGSKKE